METLAAKRKCSAAFRNLKRRDVQPGLLQPVSLLSVGVERETLIHIHFPALESYLGCILPKE